MRLGETRCRLLHARFATRGSDTCTPLPAHYPQQRRLQPYSDASRTQALLLRNGFLPLLVGVLRKTLVTPPAGYAEQHYLHYCCAGSFAYATINVAVLLAR